MKAAAALRAIVLVLLVAALALPVWRTRTGALAPAWLADARTLEARSDSLLVGRAPPAIARASTEAPTARELELLAAASRRAPLYAALPRNAATVQAQPPARALSGRAAAVGFRVHGAPGDSVRVRVADETGVLDSVAVRLDPSGAASGAFRVRPPRAGWREWTVDAGGQTVRTGAWVDSAEPPRVLVRAGFPHWESKFVVRALEESGAVVETAFDLGRGQSVAAGGGTATPERLARVDAAVVLDATPVGEGERRVMADWAASRGGGVLLVGGQGGARAFGVAADAGQARAVDGPAVAWTLPPELAALPADRVRSAATVYGAVRPGTAVGATAGGGAVLALRPLGRGRAAALGLTETWRWRMEAGRIVEHREFWRALVDWLASAPRDPLTIQLPEPVAPAGARRELIVYAAPDAAAEVPALIVRSPGRGTDTLALAADPARAGVLRAAFVPADTGLYTVAFAGRGTSAAFRATAGTGAAEDGWARLAMIAGASGGRLLPADSLRGAMQRLTPAGASDGSRLPLAALLFGAVLLAAAAEWAIRRLRGAA
ncbi:hypothetical protein [Longimicrobium terrae]|uniref:Glutamine amidotransferase domain-containing protein n=1 Tax=Longimicrobium terrae TaxID=1639882 RepID=A0A841H6G2_9BACT|nr:hypothetical protein [Longimicrobium terrae]MBB4639284.1 hypothetical protein [Longimicrobium terrae]MBB6073524.1 hypothetical protein [Longimicrobium terrae]NNC32227.1 hypothetical protein [Longimicrobium terrae]